MKNKAYILRSEAPDTMKIPATTVHATSAEHAVIKFAALFGLIVTTADVVAWQDHCDDLRLANECMRTDLFN